MTAASQLLRNFASSRKLPLAIGRNDAHRVEDMRQHSNECRLVYMEKAIDCHTI
jgi:hypothetical protein